MKTVVCIMLANGRPKMVQRAVSAFYAQRYAAKRLLIWNSGPRGEFLEHGDGAIVRVVDAMPGSIGALRNHANGAAFDVESNIIAHWDSDDWSHPNRLLEQVALLEHTGADIVGYREGVFWDSTNDWDRTKYDVGDAERTLVGRAWLYRALNPAHGFGSSFLYPRATWERKCFKDDVGEDTLWLLHGRFKVQFVPSTWNPLGVQIEPRMVCAIHGENTSSKIVPGVPEWRREPVFDDYCRARMAL